MEERYTLKQYAVQLRKFLEMAPQDGDHGAANTAEHMARKMAALAPARSSAAQRADELVEGVRDWFTGKWPHTPEGVAARRRELIDKVNVLEQAAAQFDNGIPH
jgi:hypothetical protein